MKINTFIEKTRKDALEATGSEMDRRRKCEFFDLIGHLQGVEKWTRWMLKRYPQASETVVLAAVFWHDVGQYTGGNRDHAVNSAAAVKRYLETEDLSEKEKENIVHCVRAHRNNDVPPETLEAKILAWSDSASHFTSNIYWLMTEADLANQDKTDDYQALGKIERDWRDLGLFPEERKEFGKIYESWKNLVEVFVDLERKT